jgi:predicted Zn-dependent protease
MTTLEPPDSHYLDAAVGWLVLGNSAEAWHEFKQIRPEFHAHPAVLDFQWQWFAHEKRWSEAVQIAEVLRGVFPDDPAVWIHRSFALHELRRTQEAFELLLPAARLFPKESTIAYNLACYTSQLGDLPASRKWLKRVLSHARKPADKMQLLQSALQDSDLQPLWPELQQRLESLAAGPNSPAA